MKVTKWFNRLKEMMPSISKHETFPEFYSRLVTGPLESLALESKTTSSYFTFDSASGAVTLSPFGADVVDVYVNPDFVSNAKAHYFTGYAGNRIAKTLFNSHKDVLEYELNKKLRIVPNHQGTFSKEYDMITDMVYSIIPMLPLMYYKSPDIEICLSDYIVRIYKALYDIYYGNLSDKDALEDTIQDIYELATSLMYPMSVKGYTELCKSLPPHLRVRMVSVKVKTRKTIAKSYISPLVRRNSHARENGVIV